MFPCLLTVSRDVARRGHHQTRLHGSFVGLRLGTSWGAVPVSFMACFKVSHTDIYIIIDIYIFIYIYIHSPLQILKIPIDLCSFYIISWLRRGDWLGRRRPQTTLVWLLARRWKWVVRLKEGAFTTNNNRDFMGHSVDLLGYKLNLIWHNMIWMCLKMVYPPNSHCSGDND